MSLLGAVCALATFTPSTGFALFAAALVMPAFFSITYGPALTELFEKARAVWCGREDCESRASARTARGSTISVVPPPSFSSPLLISHLNYCAGYLVPAMMRQLISAEFPPGSVQNRACGGGA